MSLVGTTIRSIRLVRLIGSGGMGEVYEGIDERLDRPVAVKALRAEHRMSATVQERFLREAQLLSKLDHTNICRVYDYIEGGETDFIVLELVEGQTLRKVMADALEPSRKIDLAVQIADGLVAAHALSIVHRDVKPENVIVTADGRAKILDFGLAGAGRTDGPAAGDQAAIHPGGCSDTSLTTVGDIIGTPRYMSPEQARGEQLTAASDMYSFGLLLQELFTGHPPYDDAADRDTLVRQAMWGERPGPRGAHPAIASIIAQLTCLEPRERPTAQAALSSLQRFRSRPRRIRRRLIVAAVWFALLTLAAGMAVQSARALREAERAENERATAVEVSDFLVDLFEVSDPNESRGESITAREILDRGVRRVREELGNRPLVEARLLVTIGRVYDRLALYDKAVPLLEEALDIRERMLPDDAAELADSLDQLADTYFNLGRHEEADRLFRRSLEIRTRHADKAPEALAGTLEMIAHLEYRLGHYQKARTILEQALTLNEQTWGASHPEVAGTLHSLGSICRDSGDTELAIEYMERALAIDEESLPPDHPDLAASLAGLGGALTMSGQLKRAEELLTRALAISEKSLGPDHPHLASHLGILAIICHQQGRYDEAEALLRRSLKIFETSFGPDHPWVGDMLQNLGVTVSDAGDNVEAERLLRRALEITETSLGPDHPKTLGTIGNLAAVIAETGDYERAEPLFKKALAALPPGQRPEPSIRKHYADMLRTLGREDEADALIGSQ